jgi:hypothetical protein
MSKYRKISEILKHEEKHFLKFQKIISLLPQTEPKFFSVIIIYIQYSIIIIKENFEARFGVTVK